MFGCFFFSALISQPNISTLITLVFLLLQKFKFALHVRYCYVITVWSSDFHPSSYLQLWIDSVHQSDTAGASLGEELIGLSSLSAGDFTLRGLIAFKTYLMPSNVWTMITKIVHQLKLLHFSKLDDCSPVIAICQKHMTTYWLRYQLLLDETHLGTVKGLIELRGFHPSASTSGARWSDAATSDKDKQICFMLMSSAWFNMEELR